MSYSYDKFLRPLTESDKSIKILDDTNDIRYTIDPFIITNPTAINNILRISLKSLKVILISFSTSNEAKMALMRLREQIDILTKKVPVLIEKDIQNFVSNSQSKFETKIQLLQSQIDKLNQQLKVQRIFKEKPIGLIDGVNTIFTLQSEPDLNSEHVFLNGILLDPGLDEDYIISGKTITFNYPLIIGFKLVCSYIVTGKIVTI